MALTAAYRGGRDGLAGWFIQFGYNAEQVEALKHAVPHTERSWDSEAKRWWVSAEYEGAILRIWPAFAAYLAQPALL